MENPNEKQILKYREPLMRERERPKYRIENVVSINVFRSTINSGQQKRWGNVDTIHVDLLSQNIRF